LLDPSNRYFQHVAGADRHIDVEELQRCLTDSGMAAYPRPGGQFSIETCRLMINMLDRDQSGTMGLAEFRELWNVLSYWKSVFQMYDADRSGTVEGSELAAAVRSFGYNLSPVAIATLMRRYSRQQTGQIQFDDFIACSVRLRLLSEGFRRRDTQGQGYASLYYDDFICLAMSS
jgi:Ca2+-binding EF-hand superfamily protein